jgi:hypothetical protein
MKNSYVEGLLKRSHLLICFVLFAGFLLLSTGLPKTSYACACCSNEGDWFERKQPLESFELEIINSLKLSAKASVYELFEPTETLEAILDGSLTLSVTCKPSQWSFFLKTSKGEKGTLTCNLPTDATSFGVDLHDGRKSAGGGPLLYKEIRLEGKVFGSGIFAKVVKPETRFRLVLQGRGNNCLMAEDFHAWNLRVYDKQTDFALYGLMKKSLAKK